MWAAPLIDAYGYIYIATVTSGRVLKFSRDGVEIWRWSSVGAPHDNSVATDQVPEVPSLMGESLYLVTAHGAVVSLDLATGTEKWRTTVNDSAPGDAFSMTAGFGYVIAASEGGSGGQGEKLLTAFDQNGNQLWRFQIEADAPPAYNIVISLVDSATEDGLAAVFSDSAGGVYKLALQTGVSSRIAWPFP